MRWACTAGVGVVAKAGLGSTREPEWGAPTPAFKSQRGPGGELGLGGKRRQLQL